MSADRFEGFHDSGSLKYGRDTATNGRNTETSVKPPYTADLLPTVGIAPLLTTTCKPT